MVLEDMKFCLKKAEGIENCESVEDTTSTNLEWEGIEQLLAEEAIWRIPSFNIIFTFSDRKICKDFAKNIATELID